MYMYHAKKNQFPQIEPVIKLFTLGTMVAGIHMRKAPILAPMSKSNSKILRGISCTPISCFRGRAQHGRPHEIASHGSLVVPPTWEFS